MINPSDQTPNLTLVQPRKRWAIGDIHGMFLKLEELLQAINYHPSTHHLIFHGDYVDRGYQSREVINKLIELQAEGATVLVGNHEWLFIEGVEGKWEQYSLWQTNGGNTTETSYLGHVQELKDHIEWLKSLPWIYETPDTFHAHAPLPPGTTPEDFRNDRYHATWAYFQPESMAATISGKIGYCGHVHTGDKKPYPRIYSHYVYLDAGCGCYQKSPLIAYNMEDHYYVDHKGVVTDVKSTVEKMRNAQNSGEASITDA